jgi:hypothetical protein
VARTSIIASKKLLGGNVSANIVMSLMSGTEYTVTMVSMFNGRGLQRLRTALQHCIPSKTESTTVCLACKTGRAHGFRKSPKIVQSGNRAPCTGNQAESVVIYSLRFSLCLRRFCFLRRLKSDFHQKQLVLETMRPKN